MDLSRGAARPMARVAGGAVLGVAVVAVVVLLALGGGSAGADDAGEPTPPPGGAEPYLHDVAETDESTRDYWTPERMRDAKPAEIDHDRRGGDVTP